jgi:hypothetical protein
LYPPDFWLPLFECRLKKKEERRKKQEERRKKQDNKKKRKLEVEDTRKKLAKIRDSKMARSEVSLFPSIR